MIDEDELKLIQATVLSADAGTFDDPDESPDQTPVPVITDDDDLSDEAEDIILESEEVA